MSRRAVPLQPEKEAFKALYEVAAAVLMEQHQQEAAAAAEGGLSAAVGSGFTGGDGDDEISVDTCGIDHEHHQQQQQQGEGREQDEGINSIAALFGGAGVPVTVRAVPAATAAAGPGRVVAEAGGAAGAASDCEASETQQLEEGGDGAGGAGPELEGVSTAYVTAAPCPLHHQQVNQQEEKEAKASAPEPTSPPAAAAAVVAAVAAEPLDIGSFNQEGGGCWDGRRVMGSSMEGGSGGVGPRTCSAPGSGVWTPPGDSLEALGGEGPEAMLGWSSGEEAGDGSGWEGRLVSEGGGAAIVHPEALAAAVAAESFWRAASGGSNSYGGDGREGELYAGHGAGGADHTTSLTQGYATKPDHAVGSVDVGDGGSSGFAAAGAVFANPSALNFSSSSFAHAGGFDDQHYDGSGGVYAGVGMPPAVASTTSTAEVAAVTDHYTAAAGFADCSDGGGGGGGRGRSSTGGDGSDSFHSTVSSSRCSSTVSMGPLAAAAAAAEEELEYLGWSSPTLARIAAARAGNGPFEVYHEGLGGYLSPQGGVLPLGAAGAGPGGLVAAAARAAAVRKAQYQAGRGGSVGGAGELTEENTQLAPAAAAAGGGGGGAEGGVLGGEIAVDGMVGGAVSNEEDAPRQ